jgi:hypothetical protein
MTNSMHDLLIMLSGGDRRSIGRADEAVTLVLAEPALLGVLFDGMTSNDPVLCMRSADVAEKVSSVRPELLIPYSTLLIETLAGQKQQEVRWHVAPMLSRLALAGADEERVLRILFSFTDDRSRIVRTAAMQALSDMALRSVRFIPEVLPHIRHLTKTGSPAMQSRGRRLIAELERGDA